MNSIIKSVIFRIQLRINSETKYTQVKTYLLSAKSMTAFFPFYGNLSNNGKKTIQWFCSTRKVF